MQIKITSLTHEGRGIGRTKDGQVVFVPKTIPGDFVEVREIKEKSKILQGVAEQIIRPSKDRIEPICPYFSDCGGCDWQMVSYQTQLQYKEQIFTDILKRIGGLINLPIEPVRGSPEDYQLYYRNKIRFAFVESNGEISFSRHNRNNPQANILVDKCFLQSERSNTVLQVTKLWANLNRLQVFNPETNQGILKFILIREGKLTNDLMIDLTTTKGKLESTLIDSYLDIIQNRQIKIDNSQFKFSLYQTETEDKKNKTLKLHHLYGSDFITDQIGHCDFKISHDSFFQTNTIMAKEIYNTVLKFLAPQGEETVYDLYSGPGPIAIYLANQVKQVIGVETVSQAIADAFENVLINKAINIKFINQSVEKFLKSLTTDYFLLTTFIVDPPRAGLDLKTKEFLKKAKIKKLIYVSCNPQTLARDLKELTADDAYQIKKIQPIDCFPQTHHLESITLLTDNSNFDN